MRSLTEACTKNIVYKKEKDKERSLPCLQKTQVKRGCSSKSEGQVVMILLPAARFFIVPLPPGILAARFLAAVILPPLVFFAIICM